MWIDDAQGHSPRRVRGSCHVRLLMLAVSMLSLAGGLHETIETHGTTGPPVFRIADPGGSAAWLGK